MSLTFLQEAFGLLEIELSGMKPIEQEKVNKLIELITDVHFESLYYTDTYLIVTDQEEYEALIKTNIAEELKEVVLFRLQSFNIFVWAGNYSQVKPIRSILLGEV